MSEKMSGQDYKKYMMNTYARYPVTLVKGRGSYLEDNEGKTYLDFSSGVAVNNLGHCHPKIIGAIAEQAAKFCHCSNLFWCQPQLDLGEKLVKASGLGQIFFANSGAEANEGAIKLTRKYFHQQGCSEKNKIITMEKSFHGRTMATLTATGQDKVKKGFAPLLPGFTTVPFNDYEALFDAVGEDTAAILLEPVQAEGGVHPASGQYLQKIRKLCDERGLLLIFDEIQCGLGRCGFPFCYQDYGVTPDIVTLAKPLGGGLPLGAIIAKEKIAKAFEPGSHGSTFGGNPVAAAAGLAYWQELMAPGFLEQVRATADYLQQELAKIECDTIVEIRSKGLLIGLEIKSEASVCVGKMLAKGVIALTAGPGVIRLLPPLNCIKEQIDQAVTALREVLKEEE